MAPWDCVSPVVLSGWCVRPSPVYPFRLTGTLIKGLLQNVSTRICEPIRFPKEGDLLTMLRMYHANAGLNISTDLLVAILPVRAILKLKIAMRQKIALLVILTLGWL